MKLTNRYGLHKFNCTTLELTVIEDTFTRINKQPTDIYVKNMPEQYIRKRQKQWIGWIIIVGALMITRFSIAGETEDSCGKIKTRLSNMIEKTESIYPQLPAIQDRCLDGYSDHCDTLVKLCMEVDHFVFMASKYGGKKNGRDCVVEDSKANDLINKIKSIMKDKLLCDGVLAKQKQ